MKWIPNALTVARCVFALLVFWAFFKAWGIGTELSAANTGDPAGLAGLQQLWFQFALLGFLAGALTDFLDGYLARKLNAQSRFGVWLDPIADKLLIGLALLGLAMIFKTWLIYLPAAAIIARDVFMTWLRTTPAGKSVVNPSNLAKWKTAFEFAAVIGLMLPLALFPARLADATAPDSSALVSILGTIILVGLLWLAATLSVLTGWQYMKAVKKR